MAILDPYLEKKLQRAYQQDSENYDDTTKYRKQDGLYYMTTDEQVWRLCIPNNNELKTEFISQTHDSPIAAHPGVRRTQLAAKQWYYWSGMDDDIKLYVATCETCQRYKSNTRRAQGLLMPLPIPPEPWHTVTMDWITGLPVSESFDAILTVVDKLSKRAKYIPTYTTAGADEAARVFFDIVVRHHGLPQRIISDRDPKFTSKFWKALMDIMGVTACRQVIVPKLMVKANVKTERVKIH
jgi:hypothetical protein